MKGPMDGWIDDASDVASDHPSDDVCDHASDDASDDASAVSDNVVMVVKILMIVAIGIIGFTGDDTIPTDTNRPR